MLYGLLMLSLASASPVRRFFPPRHSIINWFDRLRGRAMGLTMVGIGAGGLVLPPVNEFLIRAPRDGASPGAASFAGSGGTVVIPLIAIYVRARPQDLGLLPDGAAPSEGAESESAPTSGLTARSAVATADILAVGDGLPAPADRGLRAQLPLRPLRHQAAGVHAPTGGLLLRLCRGLQHHQNRE